MHSEAIFLNKLALCLRLVKPAHAVFVLPPVWCGAVMAASGWPGARVMLWIMLAMLGIWCAAMTYNRIADRAQDAANPRTAHRILPSGKLSLTEARLFCAAGGALFLFSSAMLGELCLLLAFPALALALAYSHVKYYSWLCHFVIGAVVGLVPVAGWLAYTPHFAWAPVVMGLGLLFWVAGFDIIYACQDADFDRAGGIYSAPAKFGEARALFLAALCHLFAALFLLLTGIIQGLGFMYFLGIVVIAGLLYTETRLVRAGDLSRVATAFLTCNALVALVLLLGTVGGLYI